MNFRSLTIYHIIVTFRYLLNPLSIGVCGALNVTTFLNALLSIGFYCVITSKLDDYITIYFLSLEKINLATFIVCLASQLNIYYVQLLFAVPLKENAEKSPFFPIVKRFILFISLYSLNFLHSNWSGVINGNLLFL